MQSSDSHLQKVLCKSYTKPTHFPDNLDTPSFSDKPNIQYTCVSESIAQLDHTVEYNKNTIFISEQKNYIEPSAHKCLHWPVDNSVGINNTQ